MKRIVFIFTALLVFACSKYDDGAVKQDIGDLKKRVESLEQQCKQLNTNIASVKTIAESLQLGMYLTSVTPITDSGVIVGYRLTYNTSNSVELYNGIDGKDGAQGNDGHDGSPGSHGATGDKGADGAVPAISITLHEGRYYWALGGTLLRDGNNNPIPAVGQNGMPGVTAITPLLRINSDTRKWEVSYDSGVKWIEVGDADSAAAIFKSVDNSDADFFVITFPDNSQVRIPKNSSSIGISTSVNNIVMPVNGSETFNYTLSGEFVNAKLETINSDKGWSVTVIPTDLTTGTINITAPDKAISNEILILAYNGIHSTAIRKVTVRSEATPASVVTASVTKVKAHTAFCGGSVVLTGGVKTIERGICWSTSNNPTIDDSKLVDYSGLNSYSLCMTGLNIKTTYHVRAYVINTAGTSYGNEVSFTTSEVYDGVPSGEEGKWMYYAASSFSGGTGTEADPYIISSAEEFAKLSNDVNGGNSYYGRYFKLGSEIDLSYKEHTPIGSLYCPFQGVFDGNGKRIIGLYINLSATAYVGLFGFIQSATIKNLGVAGYVIGKNAVGGIVGESKDGSKVHNCFFTGEVNGTQAVGGVVGHSYISSYVLNCYNSGNIIGSDSDVGGVVGYNRSSCSVSNCYNIGETVCASVNRRGGVVGCNEGVVSSSYYLVGGAEYGIGRTTADDDAMTKKMSDTEFKTPDAVTGLNGVQTPAPWISDHATPVNNGFPILSWQ